MSKYESLWNWIKDQNQDSYTLEFCWVESILGFPIDHSFLAYKKELAAYGYSVEKISLKEKKIFVKKVK